MDELTELLSDLRCSKFSTSSGRKRHKKKAPYWTTRKRWDEDELYYLVDSYETDITVVEIISNLPERNRSGVENKIRELKRLGMIKKKRGPGPQKGEGGRPLKDLGPRPPCPRCNGTHIVSLGKGWLCRECKKHFMKWWSDVSQPDP